jgi:hypothetical protein
MHCGRNLGRSNACPEGRFLECYPALSPALCEPRGCTPYDLRAEHGVSLRSLNDKEKDDALERHGI